MNSLLLLPAQAAAPAAGPDFSFLLMMAALFGIFYFLVLRPQQKKQSDLESAVKSLAKGDQVVTSGGLYGKVVATGDDALTLEIATLKGGQSVRVQVARARVDSVVSASAGKESSGKEAKDSSKDSSKNSGKDAGKAKDKKKMGENS